MKNKNQGFIVPLLIIAIALLVIGGGLYIYSQDKELEKNNTPVEVGMISTTTSVDSIQKSSTTNTVNDVKQTNTKPLLSTNTEVEVDVKGPDSRYVGSKFSFSYPSNWNTFESNPVAGDVMVYPDSKSDQWFNKTLEVEDRIDISIISGKIDTTGTKSINIDGIVWYSKSLGNTSIEYSRIFNNDSYISLSTGLKNKSVLESIISSFLAG